MAIEIEVTRDSSFCPGVDRAFRITEEMLFGEKGRTCSIGPLIHNPEVVRRLSMLGLEMIDPDAEELPDIEGVNLVIRSHGIDTATQEKLEGLGAVLTDATCPTVKRAQEAARKFVEDGYSVLVLGSADHPEVRSIVGRAGAPVRVIENVDEASELAEGLAPGDRLGIVCQTTISRDLLQGVLEALQEIPLEVEVKNTICESVARRRDQAYELAGRVDLMLVVGGRESSNTAKLAARCVDAGVRTHLIEDPGELQAEWFEGVRRVGVTGGASTPDWLIQETVERLTELDEENAGRT